MKSSMMTVAILACLALSACNKGPNGTAQGEGALGEGQAAAPAGSADAGSMMHEGHGDMMHADAGTPMHGDAGAMMQGDAGAMMGDMAGRCPMAVEGAEAAVRDTSSGVALSFTTSKGDVEDLRKRVQSMVAMHEKMLGDGGPMAGHPMGKDMDAGAHDVRPMARMMPAANVAMEPIERGARLVFTPKDPAQLKELREHVRMHQEQMKEGHCPMMQGK